MFIRIGFVSNSSSCSFTCPVCDEHWSGYDWDEDPQCPRCGVYICNVKGTFVDYLMKKYKLNEEKERAAFRLLQRGVVRDE